MLKIIILFATIEIIATIINVYTVIIPIAKTINRKRYLEISIIVTIIRSIIGAYLVYTENAPIIIFDIFLITPILAMLTPNFIDSLIKYSVDGVEYSGYPEIEDKKLKTYGFNNKEALLSNIIEKFVLLETAISDHNLKKIKTLCTEELYNEIKFNIEQEKKSNTQTIISDIHIEKAKISQLVKKESQIEIQVIIKSVCKTYKKGTDKEKAKEQYELYTLRLVRDYKIPLNEIDECPNCQAPLKNYESVCPYCDRKTGVQRVYKDWTIKEKRTISLK